MNLKGMIFAAGLGTRLKPFTQYHPKALVPVCGRPIIEHVIKRMAEAGVKEIVVNVHHFANQVIDYLVSCPVKDVEFYVSHEENLLLDTGGGILYASEWLKDADNVIVHNADILTDVYLLKIIESHKQNKGDVTLLTAERETSRYLYFGKKDRKLKGWSNISTGAVRPDTFVPDEETMLKRAYGGVHIFSPRIFGKLDDYSEKVGDVFSIIPFYVDNCQSLNVYGYEQVSPYHWLDIGKPDTLAVAEKLYSELQD